MAGRSATSQLLGVAVLVAVVAWCAGSYLITTPRKWIPGERVQVCLFQVGGGSKDQHQEEGLVLPEDLIRVKVEDASGNELLPSQPVYIPPGKSESCRNIEVPAIDSHSGKLFLTGHVGGKTVSHNESIIFTNQVSETFVETDKYLYKPGQKVQFRVLTITGPYLKVFTGVYPEIWIESPSGSRIAQYINVDNPAGLIHEEFQLIDEPEEGKYKIHVESPVGGNKVIQTFKVEEFVLPRFEVTIESPSYVLGSDKALSVRVCARYTYGQPVKGRVSFLMVGRHRTVKDYALDGCKDFEETDSDMWLPNANNLEVTANVTEEGTGQSMTQTKQIKVIRKALKIRHIGQEYYSKPNLPYTGQFQVKLPSGAPAALEEVEVCRGSLCLNLTTDAAGKVTYMYPVHVDFTIQISSPNYPRIENPESRWRPIMFKSLESHRVERYYSPSDSSLIIKTPEVKLRCRAGEKQEFSVPVMYAASRDTTANVTIQLVSRGQIQYTHTQEYTLQQTPLPIDDSLLIVPMPSPSEGIVRGALNLPLTVPLTASPTAKVVVWYARPDGEVVSDAQEIKIRKCSTNPVSLAWSTEQAGPGEEVELKVTAAPQSLCSLGVVDKSVKLLSSGQDPITLDDVFEVAERAMVGETENSQIDDTAYCRENHKPEPPVPMPRPRPFFEPVPFAEGGEGRVAKRSIWNPYGEYSVDQVDAIKMFEKSGLFVFTDLKVESRPCNYRERVYYSIAFRGPPGLPVDRAGGLIPRPASLPNDRIFAMPGMSIPGPPAGIADSIYLSEQMEASTIRSYFPETWLWQLSSLPAAPNTTNTTKTTATTTTTQALNLPHTITEWLAKAVCVHPEKGIGLSKEAAITTFTPFFIDLTLPPSVQRGEILPVKISVFNYLHEALPIRVVLAPSEEYDILGDPLLEEAAGTHSSCIAAQEKVVHTVKIRPNALGDVNLTVEAYVDELFPEVCGSEYVVSKRDHLIKPIRVELEGFEQEETHTKYMCSGETGNEDQYVAWRLEPPLNIVPDSARGWVTVVGDLLGPTLDNLGSLVKMPTGCGEQNMILFAPNIFVMQYLEAAEKVTVEVAEKAIKFMKTGYQRELRYRHPDGSYSAFGKSDASGSTWLTAFVVKSFAQAQQFIPIDADDISMSRDWLKNTQMENGCFLSKGKVFHKSMKGGIAGSESPVPLTAYILMALLEAGEPTTDRAITEGLFCLASDQSDGPYTMALKSYALALARAPQATALLTQLMAKAKVTDDGMYWELPASDGKSSAAGVETAAYAVLAMATLSPRDYVEDMQKVVKWISTKRNGRGGFVSTQDTVVALQALAKFEMVVGQKTVDMAVLTSSVGLDHSFRVTNVTKLLQQRVDLPAFPTTVTADLAGEGCVLVQAVLRYNIPEEEPSTAFTLSATTETAPDDTCLMKRIKVCASYTLPDLKSNMAVIEVNLISGYVPEKSDLKQAVGYGTGLVKRYEVDGRKVTFYIDEFSAEELCIVLRAQREVEVEDPKPGTVRVYDYYDPDQFVSASYTFPPPEECVSGSEIAAEIEGLIIPE